MEDNATFIIAEIGTSHGGSTDKAKHLADAAAQAGADCIKFQWVYADEILHPDTGFVQLPGGTIRLYDRFKELEMPAAFFKTMRDYVRSLGKCFMCSPFGIRSLEELFILQPDYIKIASPELNHFPMLKKLVELESAVYEKKTIPVVLSSGVSTLEDIRKTLDFLEPLKKTHSLSLLHCITSYPAPPEEYNLSLIERYTKEFGIRAGVSDHSLHPLAVPVLSIVCGGSIIEKHITLSRTTDGLDDPVALTPDLFADMVKNVRLFETLSRKDALALAREKFGSAFCDSVIGNGEKVLAPSEKANYGRTNRSIHFIRDMKKGQIIREADIAVLRTEKELSVGISPEYYEKVLGLRLVKNVRAGEGLQWEHTETGI